MSRILQSQAGHVRYSNNLPILLTLECLVFFDLRVLRPPEFCVGATVLLYFLDVTSHLRLM